ncbi:MAG: HEAT repeat domain-containing protein [Gammaproteobacteria bacterium]|nr:HEAT repeat domain-containing protein [Gammaproteobacteria bacterium]
MRRYFGLLAGVVGGVLLIALFVGRGSDTDRAVDEPRANGPAVLRVVTAPINSDARKRRSAPTRLPIDTLLEKVMAADDSAQALKELQRLAAENPDVLGQLIGRYRLPPGMEILNQEVRCAIMDTLRGIAMTPEVLVFAKDLARSHESFQRRHGFELLQKMSVTTADTRELITQALTTEKDAPVLSQAIAALGKQAVPYESEAVVTQLRKLAQHEDSEVRRQSVQALSYWDSTGGAETQLYRALGDSSYDVRFAAVESISESGVRSERLKATLTAILNDANEHLAVRGGARVALESFP